ncbi:hypothetical protein SAMD00019534_102240 [Acytostelium subglobosum LB1]|uniref:hypothetical protein n=1 Tax=Acytostelium subglobosum LB1 TaxID=1410327 RepID=UPI000644FA49|nr:hypothetical protein SAMD00019534_102240 [Acytostelium subglobosum LB1]GAM27049.1 hypothetical protein SAMD00019534_102240 [Acytostelium subglobosum LB1]|eukprot:XP_012749929.1 hypothetical protein SAMD00019534_102240 [Acytostelium subglobosum LB1]
MYSDFIPYVWNHFGTNDLWVGYYASRPELKMLSRKADSTLRMARVFNALERIPKDQQELLDQAQNQCSFIMHHDAITGTSQQFVVNDYFVRLGQAIQLSKQVINEAIQNSPVGAFPGDLIDTPILDIVDNMYTPVIVINSLAWRRNEIYTVKVPHCAVQVFDGTVLMKSDCNNIKMEPFGYELSFLVDVGSIGFHVYHVLGVPIPSNVKSSANSVLHVTDGTQSLWNHHFNLHMSNSGLMGSIDIRNLTIILKQKVSD